MENQEKLRILQSTYAGVLADAVLHMGREGVLEEVTRRKKKEQGHGLAAIASDARIKGPVRQDQGHS